MTIKDNGMKLRSLLKEKSVTQMAGLGLFNRGQARLLSISQWKAYLANPESSRRSPCPDAVLERMNKLLK